MARALCKDCGKRPKWGKYHRCVWCQTKTLPIMEQVARADRRLALAQAKPGYVYRARVRADEWPEDRRWCAGCQSFVPLDYCTGSRCVACASRAAHAGRIEKTYEITAAEWQKLFEWQGGRCAICGRRTKKRLATDHDHDTNEVRGLLCADDEWGCNTQLARILNDVEAARRLVAYVTEFPLVRMKMGQPPMVYADNPRHIAADRALGAGWTVPPMLVDGLPPDPFDPRYWPRWVEGALP